MWSRAISGMYDSVRWIRNASSSGGWSRSSEWQWLSTIGMASRSRATGDRGSVHEEVVVELERLVLVRVGSSLRPADLDILGCQPGSERRHEHLVPLQLVERLGRRQREATDPAPLAFVVAQVARVLVDRFAGIQSAVDAVERRGDHAAERDVRVGAVVARLELEVRRRGLVVPVAARDSNRGLPVLDPP